MADVLIFIKMVHSSTPVINRHPAEVRALLNRRAVYRHRARRHGVEPAIRRNLNLTNHRAAVHGLQDGAAWLFGYPLLKYGYKLNPKP